MFLGEYTPTLDGKGRLILPAKFREQLESAFLTSEVERCLALWPPADFESRARELREAAKHDAASHDRATFFFAGAQEVVPDKQGRILVPARLQEAVGIHGPTLVVGAIDRIELWSPERFAATTAEPVPDVERLTHQIFG